MWTTKATRMMTEMANKYNRMALRTDLPSELTDEQEDQIRDFYREVRLLLDIKHTTWSIHSMRDFNHIVTEGRMILQYDGGWGTSGEIELLSPSWWEVWQAADKLIGQSGDSHHIFIERVEHIGKYNNLPTFIIQTGS
jgi:hypothetical protein